MNEISKKQISRFIEEIASWNDKEKKVEVVQVEEVADTYGECKDFEITDSREITTVGEWLEYANKN